MNAAGSGSDTANGGQSDNKKSSADVIYRDSNQDSDSWDDDTAGRDRRGMRQKNGKRKVGHHQCGKAEAFSHLTQRTKPELMIVGTVERRNGVGEFGFVSIKLELSVFHDE